MNNTYYDYADDVHCDIFISYRHEDIAAARALYGLLIEQKFDVFWDQELKKHKIPRNEYAPVLERMVAECKDFILILSRNTFDKKRIFDPEDWIAKELEVAMQNHESVHIMVYSIDGTSFPPSKSNVPESINKLINTVQCSSLILNLDDYEKIYDQLTDQLESCRQQSYDQQFLDHSAYTLDEDEKKRLKLQAKLTEPYDKKALDDIIAENPGRTYKVLDVGCASGFVGRSRFSDACFTEILGIDKDEKCIYQAKDFVNEEEEPSKFSYEVCDLQNENQLRWLLENKHTKFDIIFAAQVLHHLRIRGESNADAAAISCLSVLTEFLADDGYIIIRTTDDDMKLAGTDRDNKLIHEIMELTYANKRVTADRKTGRKLYSWFHSCGIEDVRILPFCQSTERLIGQEKMRMYEESFKWRLMPYDEAGKKDLNYKKMENKLHELKNRFLSTEFWYCGFEFIGIGHKKG